MVGEVEAEGTLRISGKRKLTSLWLEDGAETLVTFLSVCLSVGRVSACAGGDAVGLVGESYIDGIVVQGWSIGFSFWHC